METEPLCVHQEWEQKVSVDGILLTEGLHHYSQIGDDNLLSSFLKMKQLLLILTLILSFSVISQNTKQDVIEETLKEIEAATSDTAKSRHYVTLAITYRNVDIYKSDSVSQIAFDLALRSGDKYYLAKAIDNLGQIDLYQGNYDMGVLKFEKALDLLDADSVNINNNDKHSNAQMARIYDNLGMSYDYKGEYGQAIKYYLAARDIFQHIGRIDGVGVVENNLGISYLYLQDFENSKTHFETAYKIYIEEIKDTNNAYSAKMNLGIIDYFTGDTVAALEKFREVAIAMEKIGNLRSYGSSVTNIAEMYQEMGESDSAFFYLEKAIEVDKKLNNIDGLETDYRIMGSLYRDLKDYQNARKYYFKALDINMEVGRKYTIEQTYVALYELEKEAKNFEKALEFLELQNAYKDSLMEESNTKIIGKMEAEHEFNKELAVQKAKDEQKLKVEEEKRRKSELVLYYTIGIILVVVLFAILVLRSLRETKKQKELVQLAKQEIEVKNQELVDSITYAKRIQTAILPPDEMVKKLLPNSFVIYIPKDIVAGDFYWMQEHKGKVLFAAADCTGHGVPGAMVSVVCNSGLNRAVREFDLTDPGAILSKTRELVVEEFEKSVEDVKDGMDIALCSLEGNTLQYAGAHNPLWIIRNGSDEIEEIKANKQPIGKFDNPLPYQTHEVQLNSGDLVYIFSDGYADQFGGDKGKKFKASNFKQLLLSIKDESLETQNEQIVKNFHEWKGSIEQLDDVCIIGVRI